MTDNKVVIKINVDRKSSPVNDSPQMITVWHTRRILVAVLVLVLLAMILVSWLGGDAKNDDTQIVTTEKVQQINKENAAAPAESSPLPLQDNPVQPASNKMAAESPIEKNSATPNKPAAIIFSRKVVRASLNANLKDNEPGQAVKLPLNIVRNQPIELFYFTEVRNFPDKVLFHQWLRNGQMVHQKQLDIKSSRSKDWSSRVFSVKDKGEWQVRLSDKKSKVYSEANFQVNAE